MRCDTKYHNRRVTVLQRQLLLLKHECDIKNYIDAMLVYRLKPILTFQIIVDISQSVSEDFLYFIIYLVKFLILHAYVCPCNIILQYVVCVVTV